MSNFLYTHPPQDAFNRFEKNVEIIIYFCDTMFIKTIWILIFAHLGQRQFCFPLTFQVFLEYKLESLEHTYVIHVTFDRWREGQI